MGGRDGLSRYPAGKICMLVSPDYKVFVAAIF